MLLTFRDCELDTTLFVLRRAGQARSVEPQVFNLLAYLAQHRDRVVPRQELLDALWPGRIVGESAVSSCVKAARQAVGDSGEAQSCIATIQRRGYRFVAPVREQAPAGALPAPGPAHAAAPRSASIAVMPFADLSAVADTRGGLAGALAHDVITRLAQLRSLFVIAQGTVFSLDERSVDPREAGRLLQVDYVASGTVRRQGRQLVVTAELAETAGGRLLWADIFDTWQDEALRVLDDIGSRIVACIASEIELVERNRALLKAPESLNAWEAHHRGLWHMYRFSRDANEQAQRFFDAAVRLDPGFSRAWAALSFTHFQNAFQGWSPREGETARAYAAASQSLVADERNPAAHWAMGRALWLRGQQEPAVGELAQAVHLSPSFALAHYTLAFVQAQAGDPQAAIAAADQARRLSPYDPLLFGMLGARAIALVRLGRFEEAADCAVQAAARPNAHVHIQSLAAYALALAGALDEARRHAQAVRRRAPGYDASRFLATFQLDPQGAALFRQGAQRLGMT